VNRGSVAPLQLAAHPVHVHVGLFEESVSSHTPTGAPYALNLRRDCVLFDGRTTTRLTEKLPYYERSVLRDLESPHGLVVRAARGARSLRRDDEGMAGRWWFPIGNQATSDPVPDPLLPLLPDAIAAEDGILVVERGDGFDLAKAAGR
jgi:hypothetical protein